MAAITSAKSISFLSSLANPCWDTCTAPSFRSCCTLAWVSLMNQRLLLRRACRAAVRRHEVLHRRLHAARLVRDASERERHFRLRQPAHEVRGPDSPESGEAKVLGRIAR